MNNVKVILTVYTEGATLKRESKVIPTNKKGNFKKSKKVRETFLVPETIKHSIKLTKEFYVMTKTVRPSGTNMSVFKRMTNTQKLIEHLKVYAHSLYPNSTFSYEVLED